MSVLRGNDLILFHGATDSVISRSTSCSLEMTNEEQEITSKTSGEFEETLAGKMKWSISTDGLVDFDDVDGYQILNAAMFSKEAIDIAVGVATKDAVTTKPDGLDTTTNYYSGKVKVMSLTLNTGDATGVASYSATLKGDGVLDFVAGVPAI